MVDGTSAKPGTSPLECCEERLLPAIVSLRIPDVIAPIPSSLEQSLRDNPVISELFNNWTRLDLPNCWIVAGAIVQSYWNSAHGFSPLHGVCDVDVVYFDPNDLSEESEASHAARINAAYEGLPIRFDVKNEARVHLWYEDRFGYPIESYSSAETAIDTFPTTAGAIGVRPAGDEIVCYTTFGFDDLMTLIVRPNKRQITRSIYERKIARWRSVWPMLKIIDWDDE